MGSVTVSRTVAADVEEVGEVMADVEAFMRAGGFTEASTTEDEIYLRQDLGLGQIDLYLDVVEDPDAALAYEQREGIFEEMRTRYTVEPADDGTRVAATTEFTLGGIVGTVLDPTIIKRKRRKELNAQFDHLEEQLGVG